MTANTTQSRKAKGRNLQKQVVADILEHFNSLSELDVRSTSMGASGVDVQLSSTAQYLFPYSIECKAVESLNIWSALQQAEANKLAKTTPLLIFKKARTPMYACIPWKDFLKLTGGHSGKNLDRVGD